MDESLTESLIIIGSVKMQSMNDLWFYMNKYNTSNAQLRSRKIKCNDIPITMQLLKTVNIPNSVDLCDSQFGCNLPG